MHCGGKGQAVLKDLIIDDYILFCWSKTAIVIVLMREIPNKRIESLMSFIELSAPKLKYYYDTDVTTGLRRDSLQTGGRKENFLVISSDYKHIF